MISDRHLAWARRGAALLLVACGLSPALAEPLSEEAAIARGTAIAERADAQGQGYGDVQSSMTMVLRTPAGDEAVRVLRSRALEGADGRDRSLIIFDEPRDVAGTALLTHANPGGDDGRWLYLPSVKRVKRIASSGQSGAFMGSEFSYEDLGPQDISKYRFKWLRDEPLDGTAMHVLERIPKDPDSGYARQVVWMDQADLRLHKVEFYDRRDRLQKTLTAEGFTQHDGRYWRPLQLEMRNHQSGRSTTLRFEDYQFGVGLSARDFDENRLANVR